MSKFEVSGCLSRLQVRQKIGLGYALALGIAVTGTILGIEVGDRYYQRAVARKEHARNEVELLHRLQTSVLQARTHQQQLIPLARDREKFEEEYAHILIHRQHIEETWDEFKAFIAGVPHNLDEIHHTKIPDFVQSYDGAAQQYLQELDRLVQQLRLLQSNSPADIARVQNLLLDFTNSEAALKFDGISDNLVDLVRLSYREAQEAESLADRSRRWLHGIIASSMGISVAMAVVLALFISRAIAQPIQDLTRVARRSIQTSNFDLQVPVSSNDEIGILARTFNQLIHSVKELLKQQQTANEQLAAYSQSLEQMVRARTQELSEKNQQLQELLEQLNRTQVQVIQSEKMSSLGQLVAGVAHEINNPVNFIHGNLTHVQNYAGDLLNLVQLYQKHYPDPAVEIETAIEENDLDFLQEDLPKLLSSMGIGTARIRQIVLSLRNFSRTDEAQCKAVDIHEGIESTLLILQHRLKAKSERPAIEILRNYGDLPLVECYAGQLNQVFMNLFANAIDAVEELNETRNYKEIEKHPNQISIRTEAADTGWIQIAIADNGPGMSEAIKQQIFDPFFTTKSAGKGTGMGMAIAYQIVVEKHGGQLECFSTLGVGTEFIVRIPLHQPEREEELAKGTRQLEGASLA